MITAGGIGVAIGIIIGAAIVWLMTRDTRKPRDPYQAVEFPEPKSRSFMEYDQGDGKVTYTNLVSAFHSGATAIILDGWSIERENRYHQLAEEMGLHDMQPDDPALFEAHKEVMRRLDEEDAANPRSSPRSPDSGPAGRSTAGS